jgi:hypothetical protein
LGGWGARTRLSTAASKVRGPRKTSSQGRGGRISRGTLRAACCAVPWHLPMQLAS